MCIDLQAHGETSGEAITLGYRESADVVAAREWIKRTAPARRIGVGSGSDPIRSDRSDTWALP